MFQLYDKYVKVFNQHGDDSNLLKPYLFDMILSADMTRSSLKRNQISVEALFQIVNVRYQTKCH